ncbi:uncharacterized protein A4U43_C06F14300 [Asparagus officinalis]|uniref:Uncharacterized protein n=1 Tax=Asparagus officinalis TaxID=4686 RepID=A0A5P1ELV5_ASPOF|nr:uncharacterized protein A4U43_C06F14300 [Asparagus officinalis]
MRPRRKEQEPSLESQLRLAQRRGSRRLKLCDKGGSSESRRKRRALVEQEIYGQMEHIPTKYYKLLGEVASLRASRGVKSEQAARTPVLRTFEVDGIRRDLEESNRKVKRLDEALRERDHTIAQVEVKKKAAMNTRCQMDEEYAELVKI